MRNSLSKRCITYGSALCLSLVCFPAAGQAPAPASLPAPAMAGAPSMLPSTYSPPAIPRRLPAMQPEAAQRSAPIAVPAYESGTPAQGVMPAAAVAPRVDIAHQGPSSRRVQSIDPPAPGVPQPLPGQAGSGVALPIAQSPLTPQQGMAVQQILSGQSPTELPQQPVIIVMPSGWDPNGGNVSFAPRAVSPEVPIDHWPVSSRNPLGSGEGKGVFKWPKMAGASPANTVDPVDPNVQRPIFGNTDNDRIAAAAEKDKPAPKALFEWQPDGGPSKALFATSKPASESPQPQAAPQAQPRRSVQRSNTRPLFSFWRREQPMEPAAPAPQLAQTAAQPAPQAVSPQPPAVVAATVTAVASQPAEPHVAQPAADGSKTQLASATQPGLKWRAKGSPRSSSTATEGELSAPRSTNQVAVHNEPMPEPPIVSATAMTQAAAGTATVAEPPAAQAEVAPAAGVPANAPEKALLPRSMFAPKPLLPETPPATEQSAIVPSLLARVGLDNVPMRLPKRPPPRECPAPSSAVAARCGSARPSGQAACDTPCNCEGECDVEQSGDAHVAQQSMSTGRATGSYYAPAAEFAEQPASSRKPARQPAREVATKTPTATGQARFHAQPPRQPATMMVAESYSMRLARQQQLEPVNHRQRRFQTHDDVPALAKPFWALGEVTKLPRFLTGDEDELNAAMSPLPGATAQCQCPQCQEMRRMAAQAAVQQLQQHPQPTLAVPVEQPAEPEDELVEESSSRRRAKVQPVSRKAATTTSAATSDESTDVVKRPAQPEAEAAEAEDRPAAPRSSPRRAPRNQPRQVASSSVATYAESNAGAALASDASSASGVEPITVHNRKGAKVLIYNGSERSREAATSAGASDSRPNPLR